MRVPPALHAPTHHRRGASGSVLIAALIAATVLAILLGASIRLSINGNRMQQRTEMLTSARVAGVGVLDMVFADWHSQVTASETPGQPFTGGSLVAPSAFEFPGLQTGNLGDNKYLVSNVSVQPATPLPPPASGPQPKLLGSPGLWAYHYLASADITAPTITSQPVVARVRQVFEQRIESPWRFAIFYDGDLEMHPGPTQYIGGRVHSNAHIYAAHSQLSFGDLVTSAQPFINDYKPGDKERRAGEPVTAPSFLAGPPALCERLNPFGFDPSNQIDPDDANPNNDGYREMIERPEPGADPMEPYRFYYHAGVKIVIGNNASGSPVARIYKRTGDTTMAEVTSSSPTLADRDLFSTVQGALTLNVTLQDNREGAAVRVAKIDVGDLRAGVANGKISSWVWNGIVYVTDTTATPTTKRAVQLINGRSLMPGGLTVATDLGMYVTGDFNTGGTTASSVPTNNGSNEQALAASPVASGYTKQPAALIGDAVMVLSNDWRDGDGARALTDSRRTAARTTVNAGILAGNVETTFEPNSYSGGSENFPRFLENWENVRFTYYGSMLQLWQSQLCTGPWGLANVYGAPDRNWSFEKLFLSSPPPGEFLITVTFAKNRWFAD